MKKFLSLFAALCLLLTGCAKSPREAAWVHTPEQTFCDLPHTGSLKLSYADQFAVDFYQGGYGLISIASGDQFLVVPEGMPVPQTEIPVLCQPMDNIYLVASAVMCLFDALDALDSITLSGTKAENWVIDNARLAMEAGKIDYAGKYSEPDYEKIVSSGCRLSVQSTMIYHEPEVKEKLEELNIPVLVDYSSRESHPLGRTEWIKLYGVLLGKLPQAEKIFSSQSEKLAAISREPTGKTVAYFFINASGTQAVVRKSGDYVAKMIGLAGGEYIYKDLGGEDNGGSTVNVTLEEFYAKAKDADVVIYNSAIDGELNNLEDFLAQYDLLGDFKAVREGNVWCTNANLYQDMTRLGTVMEEMHRVFTGTAEDSMEFLHHLT